MQFGPLVYFFRPSIETNWFYKLVTSTFEAVVRESLLPYSGLITIMQA